MIEIRGMGISGQKGTGKAFLYEKRAKHYHDAKNIIPQEQKLRFEKIVKVATDEIECIIDQAKKDKIEWEIFESHKLLLQDSEVRKYILNLIDQEYDLLSALIRTKDDLKVHFRSMESEIMKAKSSDVEDIFEALIRIEEGNMEKLDFPTKPFILICDEILPSMLYQIPQKRLKGIVCRFGSSCSHGAIIARSKNVPVIINLKNRIDLIKKESKIIMNGHTGVLFLINE